MLYSVFDHDIGDYLHSGRNSTTKAQCFREYLEYRQQDLEDPDIELWVTLGMTQKEYEKAGGFEYFLDHISEQYVLDDMAACNFELHEHGEKLGEDF